jgi:hypothetical protein
MRGVWLGITQGRELLMELNDPVFYDDAIWTRCNTCDEYFDESKYNSHTCAVCEDKEIKGESNE